MKCIDDKNYVTPIGRFVISISFDTDIKNKIMLYYWINFIPNNIYEGLLIVSLIHSYGTSYFYTPKYNNRQYRTPYEYNTKMNEHMKNNLSMFIGKSEMETSLNIWQKMMSPSGETLSIYNPNIQKYILHFSKRYSMNNAQLNIALSTLKSLIMNIENITESKVTENNLFQIKQTLNLLRPIARVAYSTRKFTRYDKGNNNNVKYVEKNTNNLFSTKMNTPLNTYLTESPPMIVAFHTIISSAKIITMGLDIPTNKLDMIEIKKQSKYKVSSLQSKGGQRRYDNLKTISHNLPDIDASNILHQEKTLKNKNYSLYTDISKSNLIKTI